MKPFFTTLIVFFLSLPGLTQPSQAIYNLRQDWYVQEDETLVRFENQKRNTIYFTLNKKSTPGKLVIYDREEYSVFLNGQLIARKNDSLRLRVDSLWRRYQGKLFFSIHQQQPVHSLQTVVVTPVVKSYFENPVRAQSMFKNFVILAALILLTFLVILFRINAPLTLDYLNVVKLFSVHERDEAIVAGRIGASINLFFFALISFLLGLLMIVIFHAAPDRLCLACEFAFQTIGHTFLIWFLLSLAIFIILMGKLILIVSFSLLFDLRDTVRFQFFNFIRVLFVTTSIMSCLAIVYFVLQTTGGYYYHLLTLACLLVVLGTMFLFVKLLARSSFPVFHLFSYLCATEIIPLMILGKVIL